MEGEEVKVFVLTRIEWKYDETEAVAVIAPEEATARQIASDSIDSDWDRSGPEWLDPAKTTIQEFSLDQSGVVLKHLHYG